MTSAELKARADAWLNAFRGGDLDVYLTFYHSDAVVHGYGGTPLSGESLRDYYYSYIGSFELASTIEEHVWEGNRHAVRFIMRGRQTGPYLDIEPNGKWAAVPGMSLQHWQDGQIIERWIVADMADFDAQLRAR